MRVRPAVLCRFRSTIRHIARYVLRFTPRLPPCNSCKSLTMKPTITRCSWAETEIMIAYHDREWGVPVHDDRLLFEFLVLEGAQAGLSWSTILNKRKNYRRAFDNFN